MLRINRGSCMFRLGLRLIIGSRMLMPGLRLRLRLSFRGRGLTQIIVTRHADI